MLGFRKKSQNEAAEAAAAQEAAAEATAATRKKLPEKKGQPTPRRKDQEAARRRPLVHNDRKEARQAQKKALQDQRAKMRRAMETGEEKFLPARDRGPQKRWVRDYVDARTGIGEWMLLLVLGFLLISFAMTDETRALISYLLFILMFAVFTELFWVARRARKGLEARYGIGNLEKGVRFYAAMRALQMRRLRLPKPLVNRGEFPR